MNILFTLESLEIVISFIFDKNFRIEFIIIDLLRKRISIKKFRNKSLILKKGGNLI